MEHNYFHIHSYIHTPMVVSYIVAMPFLGQTERGEAAIP